MSFVMLCICFADPLVVLPINEVERVAELFLGPYIGEEHAKWGLVVREARVNRVYMDPLVCLVERSDPDAGKRKQVHGPEDLEGQGPINEMPLRAIGVGGADYSRPAGQGEVGLASKRVPRAPKALREVSSPASSSSTTLLVAPRVGATEEVASSFGIASLPLKEVSTGTPS